MRPNGNRETVYSCEYFNKDKNIHSEWTWIAIFAFVILYATLGRIWRFGQHLRGNWNEIAPNSQYFGTRYFIADFYRLYHQGISTINTHVCIYTPACAPLNFTTRDGTRCQEITTPTYISTPITIAPGRPHVSNSHETRQPGVLIWPKYMRQPGVYVIRAIRHSQEGGGWYFMRGCKHLNWW